MAWHKNIFREILTHRNCGLQKEVNATKRKITHCAGHRSMGQNKNNIALKTTKRRTFGKKCWKGLGCKIGIKNPCTTWHVHLKVERISEGFDRRSFGLEFVEKAIGMFGRSRKVRDSMLRRYWCPLEQQNMD
jgi:hypothetical protein